MNPKNTEHTETTKNAESLLPNESYDYELTIGNLESLPNEVRDKWMKLRRDYMDSDMDWHVENDYDDYDADPATLQLVMQDEHGEITAGMRLTPRSSIKDTLSWSMLPDVSDDVLAGLDGPVWDITRLVPGNIEGRKQRMAAFAELFGAALAKTLPLDDNPHWFFATHKAFISVFRHYGIEFTPIDGTERGGSQLSHAYPVDRTNFLLENQDKYIDANLSVQKGIARGRQA
ncbi:MAG: hypothetical protein WCP11_02495 [Candidatus Saccharibacteria bacterium]